MFRRKFRNKSIRVVKITAADIAECRGVSRAAVNRAHCRGLLDLRDLKSIARYCLKLGREKP